MDSRYARGSGRYRAGGARSAPVFARRRRRVPARAAALALALLALVFAASRLAASMPGCSAATDAVPLQSTPVAEWEKGSVPYLYQTDPAWAAEPYAGGTVEEMFFTRENFQKGDADVFPTQSILCCKPQ